MRLTLVLNLLCTIAFSANSFSQNNISVNLENAKVKDVFHTIEGQSTYRFFYNDELTDINRLVNLEVKNSKIEDVLKQLFSNTDITYTILENNLIVIAPKRTVQQMKVVGTVTDNSTGETMPGVNIVVEGTSTGAITDANGKFSINVPNENATLIFSFIGYLTEKIPVAGQSNIDVKLSPDIRKLEEVVVVGYGTQKKKDITGSVASVSAENLQLVPTANVVSELKGHTAGVDIVSNSSAPGATGQIRIRGDRGMTQEARVSNPTDPTVAANTAAQNDQLNGPLLIIDGIPYGGSLNDLNPNDIDKVDILKDASATAIYGSRGSNGVIIITTKRGKAGKTTLTYSGYYGTATAAGKYKMFNGAEYAQYKLDAAAGNSVSKGATSYGLSAAEQAGLANGTSTDWQKLIYRTGTSQDHQLSLSGGTENAQFALSGGYYKETGIIPGQDYKRYTLRATIDDQVNKVIKVGLNTLNTIAYTNSGGNPVGGLARLSPLVAPYNADGTINLHPLVGLLDATTVNPLSILDNHNAILNNNRRLRTFNSLYGELQIFKDLKYRLNLGFDYRQDQSGSYFGPNTFYNASTSLAQSNESVQNYENWSYTVENLLIYDKTFAEKHKVTFTGLYSVQQDHTQGSRFTGNGMPADYLQNYNLSLANSVVAATDGNNTFYERGLISYMGRLNYGYDSRYLLTVTVRRDGSSVLSSGHQWFTYPAFALGWNISNESFMENLKVISNLKLRGGWGVTSSQNISPYATLGGLSTNAYNFGTTTAGQNLGYLVTTLANKSLKWQSTSNVNLGLDFGLLKDRITGSVDVYTQKTKDILLPESLPQSNGATSTIVNAGKTEGKGIEISISSVNVQTKSGFVWSSDINFAAAREKITELQNPTLQQDLGNGWFVGQPLSVIFDVQKIGIWQTADSTLAKSYGQLPGQIRLRDVNNDGKIDANDRIVVGNFQPLWTGGMTNKFSYKGIEFSFVLFARMGMKVVVPYVMSDGGAQGYDFFNNSRINSLKRDYWTPTNPTNKFPQPDASSDGTKYSTTLGYVDGSFIKMRSINLGYNLPSKIIGKAGVKALKIYVSVINPFILYSPFVKQGFGPDPEGNGYGGVSTTTVGGTPVPGRAITVNLNAPSTRQFNVGLNVTF